MKYRFAKEDPNGDVATVVDQRFDVLHVSSPALAGCHRWGQQLVDPAVQVHRQAVMVQADIDVNGMDQAKKVRLADEILAKQPNLLASILALPRMGVGSSSATTRSLPARVRLPVTPQAGCAVYVQAEVL